MPRIKQLSGVFGLILIGVCALISVAMASSIKQVDVDDMLGMAELVFEGEVVNVDSRWNEDRSAINTYVAFDIVDVIHGAYSEKSIELSFSGGSADGLTMQVQGMIYPKLGEQGIYFVEQLDAQLVNPIVGWSQGHFLIRKNTSGEDVMLTAQNQPIVEMSNEAAQFQALSKGVAAGVQTGEISIQGSGAMTKSRFKQDLKDKLSAAGGS